MELLERLTHLPGVSGREERVRAFLEAQLEGAVDKLSSDALGNLTAVRRSAEPNAQRLLVTAHMDEIGFYVRHVDDEGFLRVLDVGYVDPRLALGHQVTVCASGGRDLVGVLTSHLDLPHQTSAADRQRVPAASELFVDLGLPARAVRELVRVGDPVVMRHPFVDLGATVTGKALDNRTGCWLLLRLLRELKDPRHHLYGVFSVQEEVGLRYLEAEPG